MTTTDSIWAAAEHLLRRDAEELRESGTSSRDRDDWTGEEEAKADYDEHIAAADALASLSTAEPVQPLYGWVLVPAKPTRAKQSHRTQFLPLAREREMTDNKQYPELPEPDLDMPWRVNAKSDGAAHSSGFTYTQMRAYYDLGHAAGEKAAGLQRVSDFCVLQETLETADTLRADLAECRQSLKRAVSALHAHELAEIGAPNYVDADRAMRAQAAPAAVAEPAMTPAHRHAQENAALLADILNRRPALNEGLRDAYARWTAEVYDLMGAMATEPANDAAAPKAASQPAEHQQEAQSPVAYRHFMDDGWEYYDAPTGDDCPDCEPLYTTPQPAVQQGEPLAWMDDGTLRAGSEATAYRVVTDVTKRGMTASLAASFITPLYAHPAAPAAQGDALGSQDVREPTAIGCAVNRAARDLPEGWEIRIDLERGAGVVHLTDPEGNETMIDGSGELFSDQINAAIDAARAAKEGDRHG